jgi:hypothetical protein
VQALPGDFHFGVRQQSDQLRHGRLRLDSEVTERATGDGAQVRVGAGELPHPGCDIAPSIRHLVGTSLPDRAEKEHRDNCEPNYPHHDVLLSVTPVCLSIA